MLYIIMIMICTYRMKWVIEEERKYKDEVVETVNDGCF